MADTKISALTVATTPLAGTEVLPIVQSGVTKQVSVANLTAGRAVSALSLATSNGLVDARAASGIGVRFIETTTGNSNRVQLNAGAGYGAVSATAGVGVAYLGLQVDDVDKVKVLQSGDMNVLNGNLIQGTAAKGINFTANTPAAGKTSQLLNWYEEGTWTPTQGNFGTWTSPVFNATYTRVGRSVTINVRQTSGTIASGAAQKYISGLPFAPATAGATGVACNGSVQFVSDLLLYSDGSIYFISDTGSQSSLQFSITYMV